jgi:excisionase family DNA binding protein
LSTDLGGPYFPEKYPTPPIRLLVVVVGGLADQVAEHASRSWVCLGQKLFSCIFIRRSRVLTVDKQTAKVGWKSSDPSPCAGLPKAHDVPNTLTVFEPLLTASEAAALLKIHPKTLQKLARQGRIPAKRIGDLWRFRASELDQWVRTGICSKSPLVP